MDDRVGGGLGLDGVATLSRAKTRSISAENRTGEKGRGGMATEGTGAGFARDFGGDQGWKVSPSIHLPAGEETVLAEIEGPGVIQHIWNTVHPDHWRKLILRMYWDGETDPSVEVPLGDFFCSGWPRNRCNVSSLPIAVNPAGGFNSYWPMPFHRSAKVTLQNVTDDEVQHYYFQIDYSLGSIPEDAGTFHAQWRRSNPLPYAEVHTILDGVRGIGHYVGTYMAWGVNSSGWWGEGEIKFFLDGDGEFPTICGTGTEDYFGGAWNFEHPKGEYGVFSTPYLGMPQVITPDGLYRSQQRFGMYRWHIPDPIRFEEDLRVTIQALGWNTPMGGKLRYLPLQDDIASTAFWYQAEPHAPFPALPDRNAIEVI